MSESTDIALLDIKPEQAPEIYVPDGLEKYLEIIEKQVSEVPDLSTAKGRARVASLAAQVSRSKTAIEKPGREYLKRLKEAVKPAEMELRRFADRCDALRDKTRLPLTEWEAEQERIKAEEKFNADHAEALEMNAERDRLAAERFESDFEIAILLNEKFDREAAEEAAEAERQRIAYEQEIQRKAAEKAKQEAEAAAQRERDEAALREERLIADAEHERLSRAAEKERAEREKQEAIEAERRKAQQAEQAEQARLAEEKRLADEVAARGANEAHRKAIGSAVVNALVDNAGLTRAQAIDTLMQIKDGNIPHVCINY